MKKILTAAIFICACFLISACGPALVVNSSADDPDVNVGDGKCKTSNNDCTLRAAIMEANASDDISEITFDNISLIKPTTALPALTAGNTRIDGNGQVTLNGNLVADPYASGLKITDSKLNYIQGLTIKNFWYGIEILAQNGSAQYNVIGMESSNQGDGSKRNIISQNKVGIVIWGINASNNTISGNIIGMKQNGVTPWPNENSGIFISNDAHDNLIGSLSGYGVDQGGNLISGNSGPGIHISEGFQNHVSGNFIGTNMNGTTSKSNFVGIRINNGSKNNIIGVNSSGDGSPNLISGNTTHGINIMDQDSYTNVIAGNLVGTNFDGSSALGNGGAGIVVGGDDNRIGTNGDGAYDQLEGNVISGNGTTGISLHSTGNQVSGNKIGLDTSGSVGIGNTYDGILIDGYKNLIGTNGDGIADEAERNIISANAVGLNGSAGVSIFTNDNTVAGNFIGTDVTGTVGLGNLEDGINISTGANGNLIGTDGDGISDNTEGNLISGNGRSGISLFDCQLNTVSGNLIGTDLNGTAPIPNGTTNPSGLGSVHLAQGSSQNVIGTNGDGNNDPAERNLISGNTQIGISLTGPNTTSNVVAGNYVGVDISASAVLGNQRGIVLGVGADYNVIGTDADGTSDAIEGNVVGGNTGEGISISGSFNQISGNYIGTDSSGLADLGNSAAGIVITDNTTDNTIGGSLQKANIIAFNNNAGAIVAGVNATNVLITFNSIHSNDRTGIYLEPLTPSGPFYTPNDPGDVDSGPNDQMNYPELSNASSIMTSVAITGEIVDGLPNTQFEIQFFSNAACDTPSMHGEGKNYIGSSTEQTDSNGNVQFLVTLPSVVPPGNVITATATTDNKTSEFSDCVEVVDAQVFMEKADEEEELPCPEFVREEMTITTFNVRKDTGQFILYVKNSSPYPDFGSEEEWEFTAFLGEIPSETCGHQDFPDRVYCTFLVPPTYYNSKQTLQLSRNVCPDPFFVEDVTIFALVPDDPSGGDGSQNGGDEPQDCHQDLGERACIAAGGTYSHASGQCVCRR